MSKKTVQRRLDEARVERIEKYTGIKMYPYQRKIFLESLKHQGKLPRG